MRFMKEAFLRVLVYFAAAVFLIAAFGSSPTTLTRYIGNVISAWAIFAVIGETIVIVRNVRHNRRLRIENEPTKEFYAPETTKLQ